MPAAPAVGWDANTAFVVLILGALALLFLLRRLAGSA